MWASSLCEAAKICELIQGERQLGGIKIYMDLKEQEDEILDIAEAFLGIFSLFYMLGWI